MPIIKLSSEPTISFTVDTYKLLAGTLPEHNTLHWFSEYVYLLEIADVSVIADVVQQLGVRVRESARLDGWAQSVLHNIEDSGKSAYSATYFSTACPLWWGSLEILTTSTMTTTK